MSDDSLMTPTGGGKSGGRIFRWSVAHTLIRLEEYAFDYVLYPYLLYAGGPAFVEWHLGRTEPTLGYWVGFAAALLASILLNLIYVWAYIALKADLFGIEAVKRFEEKGAKRWWYRLIRWPVRMSVFAYLCVFHNPLFATIWLRQRAPSARMTQQDWGVFWSAIVVSNFGWALVVSGAMELMIGAYRVLGSPPLPNVRIPWPIG
jgi:hypothetical protein